MSPGNPDPWEEEEQQREEKARLSGSKLPSTTHMNIFPRSKRLLLNDSQNTRHNRLFVPCQSMNGMTSRIVKNAGED